MGEGSTSVPSWTRIGLVFFLLANGILVLVLTAGRDDGVFLYSRTVDEVLALPASERGRPMRVEGVLRPGSLDFRELRRGCEWRFVLVGDERELSVEYPRCVIPDTFRDDFEIDVVVQGRLFDSGLFSAEEVIPRCPTKYEMSGCEEQAPHPDPRIQDPAADLDLPPRPE